MEGHVQRKRSFKSAMTPLEIKKYLMHVLSRTGNNKKTETYLYHYTNMDCAMNILHQRFLWLGPVGSMNDYLEGEFIDSSGKKGKAFFTSFSKSEENLGMYKMYTCQENGVMLSFSYHTAQRILDELPVKNGKKQVYIIRDNKPTEETIDAEVYWTAVCYKDLHSDTLTADSVSNNNINEPFKINELAGFIKFYGWEFEKEVRICAITDRKLSDNEKVAVKLPADCTIKLVTGPEFEIKNNRASISKLTREGITIINSAYTGLVGSGKEVPKLTKTNNEEEIEALQKEVRANVVLAYANKLGGNIIKSQAQNGANYIIGEKYPLKENNSNREEAKWSEVFDYLVDRKLIKEIEKAKGSTRYSVTNTGYTVSDAFIIEHGIEVNQPPKVQIESLIKTLSREKLTNNNLFGRNEKALEWVTSIVKRCELISRFAQKCLSPNDPNERVVNYKLYSEERNNLINMLISEWALYQEVFETIDHKTFVTELDHYINTIDKMVEEYLHEPDTSETLEINNKAFQEFLCSAQNVQRKLLLISEK